ncbi:MAG: P-loop NTPase fold protein [Candidatus Coproplasma sp.]
MEKQLQDKIGRKDIVDKICGLVDSLQKDQNFCLALNGAWGSGKSFVMDMIDERLQAHREYLIVKYDAWKNNFYPDPLIAILYCVLDSIKDKFHLVTDRKTKKLLKDACKNTAGKAIDEIVSFLHNKGGKCAVVAFVVETIINVIKQAKSSILDNKLFDDYKSYQSLLTESIEVLNQCKLRNFCRR